jgi:integrase/recombinase XerC
MEIESFLLYLKNVKRYSPLTLVAYEEDLIQFSEFCEKIELIHEWTEVTLDVVRHFEVELLSGRIFVSLKKKSKPKRLAASSVRRKLSSLRAFFRYLLREGVLSVDPMENIVLPKMNKRLPVFVPDYQMDELLDGKDVDTDDFSFFRDLMFMMVAYYTGMRRSELVRLRLIDFDFGADVVRVTGKGDKQRILPLLRDLKEEVLSYLSKRETIVNGEHDFFFITDKGKPVNDKYIYRHVKKSLSHVLTLSKRSPHVLRHSLLQLY